ncbi:hypothetical protein JCM8547_006668 [Rhodosporidiobolus lusitaniae]
MSTQAAIAAAAAAAQAQLDFAVTSIVSPVVIATFLSCALCGVVLYLATSVLLTFPNDRSLCRLGVLSSIALALVDTAFNAAWGYKVAVKAYLKPEVLEVFPWEFTGYVFIWRVWIVSGRKSYILTGFKLALTLTTAGLAFYIGVFTSHATAITDLHEIQTVFYAYLSLCSFTDVLISLSLAWFLLFRRLRNGESKHLVLKESPLMRLVTVSFQTNALSLAVQVAVLVILLAKPKEMQYVILGLCEGKTYLVSVLVTLLARSSASSDPSSFSTSRNNTNYGGDRSRGFGGTRPSNSAQVQIETFRNIEDNEEMDLAGKNGSSHPYSAGDRIAVQFEVDDKASSTMEEKGGY